MAAQESTTVRPTAKEVGYVASRLDYDGRYGPEINLGLANSPIGPAPELAKPLHVRYPFDELSNYPEDPLHRNTRRLILNQIGLPSASIEQLVLSGNGSYGAGDEVTRMLFQEGYGRIIVPNYSFPNVAQWAERHRERGKELEDVYQPLVVDTLHPLDAIVTVLDMDESQLKDSVVYLDVPNNPFGVVDTNATMRVVDYVATNGGVPIIDLAFGEVLGEEFKAIVKHTTDRGGISLGSFSKVQGMPRLRTGWAALGERFTQNGYSGSQRLVFELAGESEFAIETLCTPRPDGRTLAEIHAERVAAYSVEANQELIAGLTDIGLVVEQTDLRVPIQVVRSPELPDLYHRLGRAGLSTESLKDYGITLNGREGHGDSAVRMLTPKPGQVREVIRRAGIAVGRN